MFCRQLNLKLLRSLQIGPWKSSNIPVLLSLGTFSNPLPLSQLWRRPLTGHATCIDIPWWFSATSVARYTSPARRQMDETGRFGTRSDKCAALATKSCNIPCNEICGVFHNFQPSGNKNMYMLHDTWTTPILGGRSSNCETSWHMSISKGRPTL